MKALRIVGITVGILVALLVVAAIALPMFFDPNDYKDRITSLVKDKTGRELVIEGDMELSVFPWLGVEIGRTRLGNAPGFGDAPFAAVEDVEVRVKLLPLLRREVEMSTLRLEGMTLNLARDAQGRNNWDDLVAPSGKTEAKAAGKAEPGQPPALAALAIGGIEVSDARVSWDDRQAGQRYEIRDLDLTLGAIRPGTPVDVKLKAEMEGGKPKREAELELKGEVALSDDQQRIDVSDLRLELEAKGEGLPGGKLKAELETGLSVDLAKQTLSMPELELETLGLKARGRAEGTNILGDKARFQGNLKLDEFVPRELIKRLGQPLPETSDATVLGKAGASFDFTATPKSVSLGKVNLRLDDSSLTGTAAVADFSSGAIRFDLALDVIDLDRYLPPRREGEVKAPPTPAEAAAGGAAALPVETLKALDLDGRLRIGRLKAYQLNSTDVSVTVKARDGVVNVSPAQAKLYQGSYQGNIRLDARGATPSISLDEKVSGVQAGPLLRDLTGKEEKLLGVADVSLKITGRGADVPAIQKTLNGTAAFSFRDGAVKGVNIAQLIRKAKAQLKGQPPPPETGPNQTDFSSVTGTAQIRDGVVYNDDLDGRSPLLRVSGKGKVDLPAQALDYLLTVKIVEALEGQGGVGLADLKGLAIPVRIKGTFSEPRYNVELDKVLKAAVEKKVKEKVEEKIQEKVQEKVGDKLEDQLKNELGDKLKGLFGR